MVNYYVLHIAHLIKMVISFHPFNNLLKTITRVRRQATVCEMSGMSLLFIGDNFKTGIPPYLEQMVWQTISLPHVAVKQTSILLPT